MRAKNCFLPVVTEPAAALGRDNIYIYIYIYISYIDTYIYIYIYIIYRYIYTYTHFWGTCQPSGERMCPSLPLHSTLRIDIRKNSLLFLHGFEKCLHTLRGTNLLLFTTLHDADSRGSKNTNIASRKTEVCLASAMYS